MNNGDVPLDGIGVVTLCVNVPGPATASRMREMGASVVKVEPPEGDPLSFSNRVWYEALSEGQEITTLDLKDAGDRTRLDELLENADLLLTSSRPASLERLGLGWEKLHSIYPGLCQVAIVGYPAPQENKPGHDLTYLADLGLLSPPELPRTLLADLAGAERAVSAALGLLFRRERGNGGDYAQVALSEAAEFFAAPLHYGITKPGAHLGGGFPGYNLYEAENGWMSVAALEDHFWRRLLGELGLEDADHEVLSNVFGEDTAENWEKWARERDLPMKAVSLSAGQRSARESGDWPPEKERTHATNRSEDKGRDASGR